MVLVHSNSQSTPQMVILAGGLGSRIQPLTHQMPKSMIPIGGRPFIHYQLSWLAKCGIQEVILSIGYLGEMIKNYVKNGRSWGLQVKFVDEGSELKGTGGALRLVYEHGLLRDPFLLTYGDSFLPFPVHSAFEFFKRSPAPALMTILKNEGKWDTSNVEFDGRKIVVYDKKAKSSSQFHMNYIDYGLSVFQKETVEKRIPKNQKFELSDLFHQLSLEGNLAGFEVQERFYEIGSFSGIQEFERFLEYQH